MIFLMTMSWLRYPYHSIIIITIITFIMIIILSTGHWLVSNITFNALFGRTHKCYIHLTFPTSKFSTTTSLSSGPFGRATPLRHTPNDHKRRPSLLRRVPYMTHAKPWYLKITASQPNRCTDYTGLHPIFYSHRPRWRRRALCSKNLQDGDLQVTALVQRL